MFEYFLLYIHGKRNLRTKQRQNFYSAIFEGRNIDGCSLLRNWMGKVIQNIDGQHLKPYISYTTGNY